MGPAVTSKDGAKLPIACSTVEETGVLKPTPSAFTLFATQSTLGVLLAELTLPTGHAWQLEALL
jgi:hypothetical protein